MRVWFTAALVATTLATFASAQRQGLDQPDSLERNFVASGRISAQRATRNTATTNPLLPSGPRTTASAKIAPSWTATSRSDAANRDPTPASTSSSSMPSGVAMVTRSSKVATGRR